VPDAFLTLTGNGFCGAAKKLSRVMSDTAQPISAHGERAETDSAPSRTIHSQIFHAVLSLASAALLIRLIGMANQVIVTSRFGVGARMDAYVVAASLPVLLAGWLGSVIQGSVTPIYARLRTHEKSEQASALFSTLLNSVLLGSVLLTGIMLIFRHQVILIAAPALDSGREGLAIALTPYVFPAVLLMLVIGYLQCILNTEGQFGWPAYAGMFVPLATAALVLVASATLGVAALAIGTLVGLSLQLGVLIVRLRRAKISYRPRLELRNPALGPILVAAWPLLLGESLSQVSPFVDQMMASFLSAGSISALSYALKLTSVPAGVLFVSVQRAALPHLSRQAAARDFPALRRTLHLNIWVIGTTTAVLSVLIIVLAHPLVQILFQHGTFSSADTERTATTLRGFTVGLVPMALCFIVPDAFIALSKTQLLMRVNVVSVLVNALFDFVLARFWQSFGIALATSLVYLCSACICIFLLQRMIGKLNLLTPPPQFVDLLRALRNRA
jgi:putative peptidoglycan lipid II flippase